MSSFGTESAVVLHMLAGIDATVPVIFLDTGKLFPETLTVRPPVQATSTSTPRPKNSTGGRGL